MSNEPERKFYRRQYIARRDPDQRKSPFWEVGIPEYKSGQICAFERAAGFGHTTEYDAKNRAKALNKMIDTFIEQNDFSSFEKPLLKRRIEDPNDPMLDTVPADHLAQWLTASDILSEDWSGSVIAEITRIRDVLVDLLGKASNVKANKKRDGTWNIHLA